MEYANSKTTAYQPNLDTFADYNRDDQLTTQRLEALLALNLEHARQKSLYHSDKERVEAETMKNPLSIEKAFAYFGLLLGIFPPASIFLRFFMDAPNFDSDDIWVFGVVAIVNLISATVGYFTGKIIGRMVGNLEKLSWSRMLLILPFVGILWGILAGGAGGIIIFIVGAFFGAFLGAAVGAAALPAFAVLHRWLRRGDKIELSQFLPIAFGITFIISAFILGL